MISTNLKTTFIKLLYIVKWFSCVLIPIQLTSTKYTNIGLNHLLSHYITYCLLLKSYFWLVTSCLRVNDYYDGCTSIMALQISRSVFVLILYLTVCVLIGPWRFGRHEAGVHVIDGGRRASCVYAFKNSTFLIFLVCYKLRL